MVFIGVASVPGRTAKGYGTLRASSASSGSSTSREKDRAQFAERQNLFSEYLPYAVVFGATDKWARAFAGSTASCPTRPTGTWARPACSTWSCSAQAMNGFTTTASGTISSVPASTRRHLGFSGFGGGGFSGGGFGGGGGGSW